MGRGDPMCPAGGCAERGPAGAAAARPPRPTPALRTPLRTLLRSLLLSAGLLALAAAPAAQGEGPAGGAEQETEPPAAAQEAPREAFLIRSIRVEGTRRYTPEQILRVLGLAEGGRLAKLSFERELEQLWGSLGVSASIQARNVPGRDDEVELLVQVLEMPVDLEPRFVGNEEIGLDELYEWARLRQGSELYLHEAAQVQRRIEAGYRREGFHFVEVRYVIGGPGGELAGQEQPGDVIFDIKEGPKVKVRRMVLHGNDSMPERGAWFWKSGVKELADVKLGGPSSILRIKPTFVLEELDADLVAMRQVYRDRGWLDAVVELDRLDFNAKRNRVTIHVTVDEGPRYTVASLDVETYELFTNEAGEIDQRPVEPLIPLEELLAACELSPGEPFTQALVRRDERELQQRYAPEGRISDPSLPVLDRWHFLSPQLVFDVERHQVHVAYRVAEGRPIHLREILFGGNLHTRDRVLRRELSVFPGELANIAEIQRSLGRITGTGFFTDPRAVLTHAPPRYRFLETEDPSWKDLEFIVEEGSVLQFNFTGGVGDTTGAFINVGLSMNNFDATSPPSSPFAILDEVATRDAFHGDGQSFSIFAAPGTEITQFGFNWNHPDIFGRHLNRISLGVDASRRQRIFQDYDERRDEAGLTFGRQLGQDAWLSFGYTNSQVEVDDLDTGGLPGLGNPLAVPQLLKDQEGEFDVSHVSLAYRLRRLDNRLNPRDGHQVFAYLDLFDDAWGSDFDFARARFGGELYGLFGDPDVDVRHGYKLRAQVGVAQPYGDTENVPYTERFFLGGGSTIRGFRFRGVGPNENGDAIGGETMFNASAEYRIPIYSVTQPGTYVEIEQVRLAFFADVGILDLDPFSLDTDELRGSIGFSFGITYPLPFLFSFGFPFEEGDQDDTRVFNFDLGF